MLNTRKRLLVVSPGAALTATVIALGVLLAIDAPNVFAHAGYDHSTPGDGEVVAAAPTRVDVYFLQQVARSSGLPTLVVVSEAGEIVNKGAVLDDDDRTHISAELEDGLEDGRYTVLWHTLSADDDEEAQGAFHFYVGAAPTPIPSGATPSPTARVIIEPKNDSDGSEVPAWALILGIIGGVVVGGAAGTVLGRRSGS